MSKNKTGNNEKAYKPAHEARPLTIVFVRHGQAGGEALSDVLGPPLTSLGMQQVRRVAKRLSTHRLHHIYTSNLSRALETAKVIASYHKGVPLTVTKDLREITHYHFSGLPIPKTPTVRKCYNQERSAIKHCASQLRKLHKPGKTVVIVAHGNLIRTILPMLGGRDPLKSTLLDINNTSITVLEVWSSGEAVLRLANCVAHLLPRQVT